MAERFDNLKDRAVLSQTTEEWFYQALTPGTTKEFKINPALLNIYRRMLGIQSKDNVSRETFVFHIINLGE